MADAKPLSEKPLTVIALARSVQRLPDGSPMPRTLKLALLTLATYYPNIWPGQHRLAADMNAHRSSVNRWLDQLEDAGLIGRYRRLPASTLYTLKLGTIGKCARVSHLEGQEYQPNVNDATNEGVVDDWDELGV